VDLRNRMAQGAMKEASKSTSRKKPLRANRSAQYSSGWAFRWVGSPKSWGVDENRMSSSSLAEVIDGLLHFSGREVFQHLDADDQIVAAGQRLEDRGLPDVGPDVLTDVLKGVVRVSIPKASTPRSRRASTRKPMAQPTSMTVRGPMSATMRSAIRPKNSSHSGLRS